MFYALLAIQGVLCLTIIFLVLIQQGKGADMGATFGGGSNTVFGAAGAGNLFIKVTTIACVLFMINSILLVRSYSSVGHVQAGAGDALAGSVMEGHQEPAKSDQPADAPPAAAANGAAGASAPAPALPPAAEPVKPQ